MQFFTLSAMMAASALASKPGQISTSASLAGPHSADKLPRQDVTPIISPVLHEAAAVSTADVFVPAIAPQRYQDGPWYVIQNATLFIYNPTTLASSSSPITIGTTTGSNKLAAPSVGVSKPYTFDNGSFAGPVGVNSSGSRGVAYPKPTANNGFRLEILDRPLESPWLQTVFGVSLQHAVVLLVLMFFVL